MSFVQIDNYDCPSCKKVTTAELNIRYMVYTCLGCGAGMMMGSDYNNQREVRRED